MNDDIPLSIALEIDRRSIVFDAAWQAGSRPRIEDCLVGVEVSIRDALFLELLRIELEYRRRAGERPMQGEYLARFPGQASQIAAVLTADRTPSPALSSGEDTIVYWPGRTIGDYEVIDRLGVGGMGEVYKAYHRPMQRVVALKVLSPKLIRDAEGARRFQQEIRAAAKLIHPNIVTAYDAGQYDESPYLVMEYVAGRDLHHQVQLAGPLSVEQAVDYVLQAARGMAFAHARGVVHRDLKPGNLLLDVEGVVKIVDLGLARIESAEKNTELTQWGQVLGSVDYLAPEQGSNARAATAAVDVYGLGCTLHRLVTGQVVYPEASVVEKLIAHRQQPIPSLRERCPQVSDELDRLFQRMIAKQPDQRPTMAEVVVKLAALTAPGAPSEPRSRSSSDSRPRGRRLAIVTGLAAMLVLAGFSIARWRASDDAPEAPVDASLLPPSPDFQIQSVVDHWVRAVAKLPPRAQAQAVIAELKRLNPGLGGQVTDRIEPEIRGDAVVGLMVRSPSLRNIAPVRALARLESFDIAGHSGSDRGVSDLSPLRGLSLRRLECSRNQLGDLSPLRGMPLEYLECYTTKVTDLSPLQGAPLRNLDCSNTPISTLAPLRGMALVDLACRNTWISDLSPLDDCRSLKALDVRDTRVTAEELAGLKERLPYCHISWNEPRAEELSVHDDGATYVPFGAETRSSSELPSWDVRWRHWNAKLGRLPEEERAQEVVDKIRTFAGRIMPSSAATSQSDSPEKAGKSGD